jgi:hypothetical protein
VFGDRGARRSGCQDNNTLKRLVISILPPNENPDGQYTLGAYDNDGFHAANNIYELSRDDEAFSIKKA